MIPRASILVIGALLCAVRAVEARREAATDSFTLKGAGAQARDDGLQAASEGRFADAVPLLQRAARAPPTSTTPEKLSAARVENSLGGALKALGRRDEAIAAFERALALLERAAPSDGDGSSLTAHGVKNDLVVVVSNLGSVHADAGRTAQAEALYERALRIAGASGDVEATHADEDDDDEDDVSSTAVTSAVAETLNNLADLRHGQGRLPEARRLHERALAIRERILGTDHVDIAASLNNVAVLLMDERKHAEALPLLERAAKLSRAAAGKAHPRHATALANLAGCLLSLGRHADARKHYKRSVAIHTTALGAQHESTAAAKKGLDACDAAEQRHQRSKR